MTTTTFPRTRCVQRPPGRRPTGSILFAALICLLVVMSMVAAMLKSALSARRQIRVERNLRQTELLLHAGAERAAFRLSHDDIYHGETWSIPAAELSGQDAGQVEIQASQDSETTKWRVHLVAEYPFGSERSIRRSLTVIVPSYTPRVQE